MWLVCIPTEFINNLICFIILVLCIPNARCVDIVPSSSNKACKKDTLHSKEALKICLGKLFGYVKVILKRCESISVITFGKFTPIVPPTLLSEISASPKILKLF